MATEQECEELAQILTHLMLGREITFSVVIDASRGEFVVWVMSFEGEIDWSGIIPVEWENIGWYRAEAAEADLCILAKKA